MTRRRRGELLSAVFDVLAERPDGVRAREVLAEVERRLSLTDYEQGRFERSGDRRFEKLVRFQTVNAVKAGWMTKTKGVWAATDAGLRARRRSADPLAFISSAEDAYARWMRQQPPRRRATEIAPPDAEDEDLLDDASVTVEEAVETAFAEVAKHLAEMDPYDLQRLVAGLLRGMGYHVSWVSPPGKDRGLDVVAFRDPLGTEDPRIKVQVKREQTKTDVKGLRAFMSLLQPGDVGVFVTLGGFTGDAESEARNSETRRITLIDQSTLFDLWVANYASIPEEDRALLPLKPVYYLYDSDPDSA